MNPIAGLQEYFDKLTTQSPDGRALVTAPWKSDFENIDIFNTNPVKRYLPLREIYILVAWSAVFMGFFPGLRILMAIGLTMLMYAHFLHKKTWRKIGDLTIEAINHPSHIDIGQRLKISVNIRNNGKNSCAQIIIHLHFSGSSQPNQYQLVNNLNSGSNQIVEFDFPCDQTMGKHSIGPIHVTVADFLGAYELTIQENHDLTIIARPRIVPVPFLETKRANFGDQHGSVDIPIPGQSPTFLGMRPWRNGDTIRKVDWKRSMRTGDIIVKEFEKQSSAETTVIFDFHRTGHSAFDDISSLEVVKTAGLSICQTMIDRQLPVQALLGDRWIPLGTGINQFETIYKYAVPASLQTKPLDESLRLYSNRVKPGSFVILVVTSMSLNRQGVQDQLIRLKDQQIELICINIDSQRFGIDVFQAACLHQALTNSAKYTNIHNAKVFSINTLFDYQVRISPKDDLAERFRGML